MLFGRRNKQPTRHKFRNWLWPKRGFSRAVNYWSHRLGRLKGTPHSVAAGFASGVAVSFTPFLGLHIVLSLVLTFMVRGNYLAAIFGTIVGNPWTFPFIFATTHSLGAWVLNTDASAPLPVFEWGMLRHNFLDTFNTLFFPMILGGIPLMVITWFASYFFLKSFFVRYHQRRDAARALKSKEQ